MAEQDVGYGKRSVDEYLLRAGDLYRNHPELLYPFGMLAVLFSLLELRVELIDALFDFENLRFTADREALDAILSERVVDQLTPVIEELFLFFVLGIAGLALFATLVLLLAVGIALLTVADETASRERGQFARTRQAVGRVPALFVATLLSGLLVGFGLLFFVLPGLYLAVKFALGGPAIVIDQKGPVDGLRASWHAVAGQFGTVLGVLALGTVAVVVVALIPFVGEPLVAIAVLPVFAMSFGILYVESASSTQL